MSRLRLVPADLSAYADGELSRTRRLRLQGHLRRCEPCRRYVEQLRLARRWAAEAGGDELSAELRGALDAAHARWRVQHLAP